MRCGDGWRLALKKLDDCMLRDTHLSILYYLVLNTGEFSGVFRGGSAHFFSPSFGAGLSQTTSTARSGNSFWNASVREFMVPEINIP
jgi:hypothetical protein